MAVLLAGWALRALLWGGCPMACAGTSDELRAWWGLPVAILTGRCVEVCDGIDD
jgi:hypothetical protein